MHACSSCCCARCICLRFIVSPGMWLVWSSRAAAILPPACTHPQPFQLTGCHSLACGLLRRVMPRYDTSLSRRAHMPALVRPGPVRQCAECCRRHAAALGRGIPEGRGGARAAGGRRGHRAAQCAGPPPHGRAAGLRCAAMVDLWRALGPELALRPGYLHKLMVCVVQKTFCQLSRRSSAATGR